MCQVFTWYGATIEMDGTTELVYTADEVCVCALLVFFFFFGILIVIWFMLFSFGKISWTWITDDSAAINDF